MTLRPRFFASQLWLAWSIAGFAGLTSLSGRAQGGATLSPVTAPVDRAREVLESAVRTETGWIWIHALEVWVELGEKEKVRGILIPRLSELEKSAFRIGVWRVLVTVADSPAERARWIARIEDAFLDPAATDRVQAIESLGKLGHVPRAAVIEAARIQRSILPEYEALFPLWALILAGDRGALTQLVGSLQSPDVAVRRRAAFVLRWLRPEGPWVRVSLARALANEPDGTIAKAYMLCSALTLSLEASQLHEWMAQLERIVPTAPGNVCLEACQALRRVYTPADVVRLLPLLDNPDADARIGAAWAILHVLGRK